ncbi:MAG: Rqc2 family fibronectin-binding protein [Bacillota bacterium]
MPFDGMVLAAVRNELSEALTGLRIDRVYQPSREEIHLIISRPGQKYRLLLSADPSMARAHLTGAAPENPPSPPVFCMVLRKHLEGGRIAGFSQTAYDRVLIISVDSRDELGRPSQKALVCEIMGKHSNIILLDPDSGVILDGIKRYSHSVSRHREVLPGRSYIPAPAQNKINPLTLGDEEFFSLLLQNPLNSRLSDLVQRHFDGLSPLIAREVVWRAGLDPGVSLDTCGEFDLSSLYRALRHLYSLAGKAEFRPTIALKGKDVRDFAAFELTHLSDCSGITGSMNQMVDRYFSLRSAAGEFERLKHSLMSLVKKETGRLEKKLSAQQAELESASDAESMKLAGELITANIHRLQRGEAEAYLDNFYEEGCPPLKVILDQRLSPAENAQNYFRRYAKSKKVREAAARHAESTREELMYLSGVENSIELASSSEELSQIKAELADQGYLKLAAAKKTVRKEPGQPRPAAYMSCDGFTILVGKNNRQNDHLTMKLARQDDIWLHTKDIPGSHVVIKTEGKKVPPSTLEEAAGLAALFSRAGQSRKVPVDYTLRKFVSKPRGAKPGFVIYTDQRTVYVDPDGSLPDRLSQAGDWNPESRSLKPE